MANEVVKAKLSTFLTSDAVKTKVNSIIGNPQRGAKFIASLTSAVSTNPALDECEQGSLVNAALVGEALNLSPSPQLGHYYIVPFKDNKSQSVKAQFNLGWKGYVQLALRSGQYKTLNAVEIKEGELKHYDRLTDEVTIEWLPDVKRDVTKTVGYVGVIELMNGFKKTIYWSKEKMEAHATKYSMGYRAQKGYTFWEKSFDEMALKTIIRQLISKWGIMSIEMQSGYDNDMAEVQDDGRPNYVDNVQDLPKAIEPVANKQPIPVEVKQETTETEMQF